MDGSLSKFEAFTSRPHGTFHPLLGIPTSETLRHIKENDFEEIERFAKIANAFFLHGSMFHLIRYAMASPDPAQQLVQLLASAINAKIAFAHMTAEPGEENHDAVKEYLILLHEIDSYLETIDDLICGKKLYKAKEPNTPSSIYEHVTSLGRNNFVPITMNDRDKEMVFHDATTFIKFAQWISEPLFAESVLTHDLYKDRLNPYELFDQSVLSRGLHAFISSVRYELSRIEVALVTDEMIWDEHDANVADYKWLSRLIPDRNNACADAFMHAFSTLEDFATEMDLPIDLRTPNVTSRLALHGITSDLDTVLSNSLMKIYAIEFLTDMPKELADLVLNALTMVSSDSPLTPRRLEAIAYDSTEVLGIRIDHSITQACARLGQQAPSLLPEGMAKSWGEFITDVVRTGTCHLLRATDGENRLCLPNELLYPEGVRGKVLDLDTLSRRIRSLT